MHRIIMYVNDNPLSLEFGGVLDYEVGDYFFFVRAEDECYWIPNRRIAEITLVKDEV
jgi:hypothetical protein